MEGMRFQSSLQTCAQVVPAGPSVRLRVLFG